MSATLSADVVVIGGGSGGLAAAFRAAGHGARVVLLSGGEIGGTCVNVGCVPKKAMWLAAELSVRSEMAARVGFALPPPVLDWKEFITHRQRYIANIHTSYERRLDAAGIQLMPTHGRLDGPGVVRTADGVRIDAPQVVVATGGHPTRPDVPGAGLGIDSDGFFNLCAAPRRVAIIGGGYIGIELAGLLQSLGSRVDILLRGTRVLDAFDSDLTAQLVADYAHYGTRTHVGMQLRGLRREGDAIALHAGNAQGAANLDGALFDTVIFATGRAPNTAGLGLETVGAAIDAEGYIQVDDQQRTTAAGVHAIGDVTDRVALTPVAIAAGRRLMDRLFGGQPDARLDYANIPTVVFSHPPMGMIGLTEAQARVEHGDAVRVHVTRFRPMLHALADSPQRSLFKLVCVGADERVVGIHLLGEGSDEILQGFAVAMKLGLRKRDLDDTVAIHPTSAEELVLLP